VPFEKFTNLNVEDELLETKEHLDEMTESGNLIEVKEIGSGAAFGEMSLMYDHLRSATIQ
jgi:hypothetical protein